MSPSPPQSPGPDLPCSGSSYTALPPPSVFFFLNNPAPPEFSPLPLPAALRTSQARRRARRRALLTHRVPEARPARRRLALAAQAHGRRRLRGHRLLRRRLPGHVPVPAAGRSEEHTSELQSPCNLVCRLLLEKKK